MEGSTSSLWFWNYWNAFMSWSVQYIDLSELYISVWILFSILFKFNQIKCIKNAYLKLRVAAWKLRRIELYYFNDSSGQNIHFIGIFKIDMMCINFYKSHLCLTMLLLQRIRNLKMVCPIVVAWYGDCDSDFALFTSTDTSPL